MKEDIKLFREIRMRLAQELDDLTLDQLNFIPKSHNNNIMWNIGHCLVVQQLLSYKLSGLPTYVDESMIPKYGKGSKPEVPVTQEEVDFIKDMLIKSVDLLEKDTAEGKFKTFQPLTVGFGAHLTSIADSVRFNNAHEGLHYGYLLALKKLL